MIKIFSVALITTVLAVPLAPVPGWSWYNGSRHGSRHHHQSHHGDEALVWGLGGLVLGTVLAASAFEASSPPPPPRVVYAEPVQAGYSYRPRVDPGMCRWERYVLDGYGGYMYDAYGRPVKEYTTGPCDYPPNG